MFSDILVFIRAFFKGLWCPVRYCERSLPDSSGFSCLSYSLSGATINSWWLYHFDAWQYRDPSENSLKRPISQNTKRHASTSSSTSCTISLGFVFPLLLLTAFPVPSVHATRSSPQSLHSHYPRYAPAFRPAKTRPLVLWKASKPNTAAKEII
jgi:hypothetical protein